MSYKHIVLFKIKDEVSEADFNKALQLLQDLGTDNEEILMWKVVQSVDSRKGRIIIEDSEFVSEEAFQRFRADEKHAKAVELMREIADWLVGDYLT
jgi:hypothetical protein